MMRATLLLVLVVLLSLGSTTGFGAQSFDAQFVVMVNDGTNYDIKVQIKANESAFAVGTSNLVFSFDVSAVSSPVLQAAHNFSGGSYQAIVLAGSGNSRSVNIELNTAGTGTTLPTSYTDVVTIHFTTLTPGGGSNLVWNAGATVVYKDDEATTVPAGTLNDLNTSPLPIQLASFSAALTPQGGGVLLKWTTVSEINNYGFEVERSAAISGPFQTIAGSFIAGNGTTLMPHSYSYVDNTAGTGRWFYRLKQTDLDKAIHYSDAVSVEVTTSVEEQKPTSFALLQNYPNPFNPATTIRFALPTSQFVSLIVYDLAGREVGTLVNGVLSAGFYEKTFDASNLSSGVYVYRLKAGNFVDTKKLVLVR